MLFDFGGTLDLGGAHWLDRFVRNYAQAGIVLTREELDLAYSDATQRGYRAGERIYGFGLRQLLEHLVGWQIDYLLEHLPHRVPPSIRDRTAQIAQYFCRESALGFEQSRAALVALSSRFRIGVVSNFYGNLEQVLEEARLAPFIDAVIDSSRVGAFKPDPTIYLAALDRIGALAEHTAMVGDSLSKDCAPARSLGLKAVWLMPVSADFSRSGEQPVDLVVRDLGELVEKCLGTR